jgi:putative transposase
MTSYISLLTRTALVSGHDFSHAVTTAKEEQRVLAPAMSRPTRHANLKQIVCSNRTFFATTCTIMSRRIFQSGRNANLLIDVLRSYVAERKFQVRDFVIMPDHVHLLITVSATMSIEKAMQLIKGGFSCRFRKETGSLAEVWQKGFSEVRVENEKMYDTFRAYIAENPIKAGLAKTPEEYPYCYTFLAREKQAAAEARNNS